MGRVIMPVWTCPNTECAFDKNLKSGQHCPLCGKEAQAFDFDAFGILLKEKWKHKKSVEKTKSDEVVARMIKFCPRCGSPNINAVVFYRPSIWRCLDCGYEGTFVVQDGILAEKIRKDYQKTHEEK
jgi:DNA-directed RNA polymerase subunit M